MSCAGICRCKLSLRELGGSDGQRGLSMVHTRMMRWVHHYTPEFEYRCNRFVQPAGTSWHVNETYVKVRGEWVYPYRAVDRAGNTVESRPSPKRAVAAAKAFFRRVTKAHGSGPRTVTLDGYAASYGVVREPAAMPGPMKISAMMELRLSPRIARNGICCLPAGAMDRAVNAMQCASRSHRIRRSKRP